jgi:hypothetical protein
MTVVLSFSLIALFLTYLESRARFKYGFLLGFVIITLVSALRYDYSNDYWGYYDFFREYAAAPFKDLIIGDEPAWSCLCKLFSFVGGYKLFVFGHSVICNAIVYSFIKHYVPTKSLWFAFFVYIFTPSLYVLSMSMMRQFLAMCIVLMIWILLEKKRYVISVILIALAYLVHNSVIVVIPFLVLGVLQVKQIKFFALAMVVFFVFILFNKEFMQSIFERIIANEVVSHYGKSYSNFEQESSFGLGYFVLLIPFAISIYLMLTRRIEDKYVNIVLFSCVGYLMTPFGFVLQIIQRLGYYFMLFTVVVNPIIYARIQNKLTKVFLLGLYILMTFYTYYGFFHSEIYAPKYSVYHSILFE